MGYKEVEQDHDSEEEHVEKEWNEVKQLTKCSKRATTQKSKEEEKRVDE